MQILGPRVQWVTWVFKQRFFDLNQEKLWGDMIETRARVLEPGKKPGVV